MGRGGAPLLNSFHSDVTGMVVWALSCKYIKSLTSKWTTAIGDFFFGGVGAGGGGNKLLISFRSDLIAMVDWALKIKLRIFTN